jgi:hypothetical protein
MATVFPTCPVPVIDVDGITVPLFADYLTYFTGVAQALYGSDIDLDPDTQDGQLIGAQAQAAADNAMACANAYAAMSPATAVGVGLSSVVKINGIKRTPLVPGSVLLTVTGLVGATITNGLAGDNLGNQWALPSPLVIPSGGTTNVTAVCTSTALTPANANTIVNIINPSNVSPAGGWYGVNNPAAAAPGVAQQQDGSLRAVQAQSTALPSQSLLNGLIGELETVPGVTRAVVYNNGTNATDANGVPAHFIWCVVEGGNNTAIGTAIAVNKTLGCGMKGTITYTYDPPGAVAAETISYDVPTQTRITYAITLKALANFNTATEAEIQTALQAYVNAIPIGGVLAWDESVAVCKLPTSTDGQTYRVQSVTLDVFGGSLAASDIQIAPGYTANLAAADIAITVV